MPFVLACRALVAGFWRLWKRCDWVDGWVHGGGGETVSKFLQIPLPPHRIKCPQPQTQTPAQALASEIIQDDDVCRKPRLEPSAEGLRQGCGVEGQAAQLAQVPRVALLVERSQVR